MKIIRASVLGYCAGVRRAVDMAFREAEASKHGGGLSGEEARAPRVFTVGSLIHNPQVLENLEKSGVAVLDKKNIDRLGCGGCGAVTVVIRAHGVTPELEAGLRARNVRIADATCPKVKKSQMRARALFEDGYRVFLAGEKHHAEIAGIRGYAPCVVVEDGEDAASAAGELQRAEPLAKTALIGQTTISPDEYSAIAEAIQAFFPDVKIIDTICAATKDRQDALKRLLAETEAVIVIGGRDSANTRRLFAIAEASGKPAFLVENAAEIPAAAFAFGTVGISAGASTPDEVIDAVEKRLLGPF